jgi:outer membrane protein assembly factor BamB
LRTRSVLLESIATVALYVVVAVVAVAFASPWLPRPDPAGRTLERYLPARDGSSALFAKLDPSGQVQGWSSQNRALTPWLELFGEIRKAPSEHLLQLYGVPDLAQVPYGELLRRNQARGQIFTARLRELDRSGQVSETTVVNLRDERGELLIGSYSAADGDLLLDPPILALPADLEPGRSWQSEGLLGSVGYRWSARVAEPGARESPVGRFDDCLRVETRLTLLRAQRPFRETATSDWYCTGIGLVESGEVDVGTGATMRSVLAGRDGAVAELLPAAPSPGDADDRGDLGDPSSWTLTRVGRARTMSDAWESTIPPLWIAGDPPLLLVAGHAGDLLALDAGDELGTIRWRFHPPGTIYGPPSYDPVRGRVYFGAGDRRLYAVDVRGLFLWSFETGDNVATRPLLVQARGASSAGLPVSEPERGLGGTQSGSEEAREVRALVVFGSEDGTVYAVDADTGQERWRVSAGGAVVSSPALVGDVVALGSDDGTVYGLDPASGRQRWTYRAGGPVEAPVVVGDGGILYVASRDGALAALDPTACQLACTATWETKVGSLLRQPPAIGAGRAFVVDEDGYAVALDARAGRRLWSTPQPSFVGPPAIVGDALVVARRDGDVSRFDFDGAEQGRWSAAAASGPADARSKLTRGPSVGGGALWLADDGAVVRRLGPPGPERDAAALQAGVGLRATQAPFDGALLFYTPVEYHDAAVVLDSNRNVNVIDPASGRGVRRATVDGDASFWPTDAVVAGDRLLATTGTTLQAVDLTTGRALWAFPGSGAPLRPPTVAGDTVLWLTARQAGTGAGAGAEPASGGSGDADRAVGEVDVEPTGADAASASGVRGVLYALGLADGAPRWQASLDGFLGTGGALVHDGAVLVSSPPSAFDLATGAPRWRADPAALGGLALGGPALDPAGATLFVGLGDPRTNEGLVAALDAADGRLRWRAGLGGESLRGIERVWLDGDTVVVPASSGAVIGLDATSGQERWRYRPGTPRLGSVTVADGRAWLVLENANVVGLDVQTGRLAARFRDLNTSLNGQGINQRPALVDGQLVVAIGRRLLAFPLP